MDCKSEPDLSSLNTTKVKKEDNLHVSHSRKSLKQTGKNVKKPRKATKSKAASSTSKSHLRVHNTKKTRAGWYTTNEYFTYTYEG